MQKTIREEIAELAHSQWSAWMKWMLPRMKMEENIKRWKRQMNTPYEKLSEPEKDSDRKEADKYISKFLKILESVPCEEYRKDDKDWIKGKYGYRIKWHGQGFNQHVSEVKKWIEKIKGEI